MRKNTLLFYFSILLITGCANNSLSTNKDIVEYSILEPRSYEYQEGDYQTDWNNSIFNTNLYVDYYGTYKESDIKYPDIRLESELEDYIVVDKDDGEGKYDRLVGMFYDNRTLEIGEDALLDMFIEHGYFLYFHYRKVGNLNFRIIEIQERDGLSIYPCRIVLQSWDEKYIYMQDITADIPRKVRNLITIDNREVPQIIIHASGFTADFTSEEELMFFAFRRSGWVPCSIKLEFDKDESFIPTYYSDGIAFSSVKKRDIGKYENYLTYRLGILEEVEKNRHFRMTGIYEVVGVTVDTDYHIDFIIIDE